jgi:hypothetical protein
MFSDNEEIHDSHKLSNITNFYIKFNILILVLSDGIHNSEYILQTPFRGGEFQYDILDDIKTLVNATVYPYPAHQ